MPKILFASTCTHVIQNGVGAMHRAMTDFAGLKLERTQSTGQGPRGDDNWKLDSEF